VNDYNIWTTADDIEIKVVDMTVSHLKNTINYIKRNMDMFAIGSGGCDVDSMYYDPQYEVAGKWIEVLENELDKKIKGEDK
jgi:hypothetical protein